MAILKRSAFSPDNEHFACFTSDNKLLIWKIFSNTLVVDYKFDFTVYGRLTSLHWIPLKQKYPSTKQAKRSTLSNTAGKQLLALGTIKGDVILYNVAADSLYSHLVGHHTDAVNDLCSCSETDVLFSCSNDTSIALWDTSSGKQISKWIADSSPVYSICIIDDNNMLSSSMSVLWWNISEKSIIKKFKGHTSEIFKLLPVNAASLNSCYFLSAAVSDVKINAWALHSNDWQSPVAAFVINGQPQDMDVSRSSSKDKPLILSVVTKEGLFHIFEHTLNGNVNESIYPKFSVEINTKSNNCSSVSSFIMSAKLSSDSNSCIVAYGDNQDMTFKHIEINELLKQCHIDNSVSNITCPQEKYSMVNHANKIEKSHSVNGLKSPSKSSMISPKVTYLKEKDIITTSSHKKLKSSTSNSSPFSLQKVNVPEEKHSTVRCTNSIHKSKYSIKDSDIEDSDSPVGMLLRGLQTQNEDLIDAVFHSNDAELITNSVKNLPLCTLKFVLEELNTLLRHHTRYSPSLSKWLKEILRIHLNHLTQSKDTKEVLDLIKVYMDSIKTTDTISKMSALKGLLSLQIQNTTSDESDSDAEVSLEL